MGKSLKNAYQPSEALAVTQMGVNPMNRRARAVGNQKQVYISPQAAINPSAFGQANGQIIFKVTDNTLDYVDKFILQFTMTNTDAAPYTFTSTHFFISNIQVRVNGNTVETIYGWQLWDKELAHLNANNAYIRGITHNFSFNAATGAISSGAAVPPGGTATYYLEFDTCLTRAGINMNLASRNASNGMEFWVYLSDQTRITYGPVGGQSLPNLTATQMWVEGYSISASERADIAAKIAASGFNSIAPLYQQTEVLIGTPAPNSQNTPFIMAGVDGTMQRIMANVVPQALTSGSQQMTGYMPFENFAFLNSDGQAYTVSNINPYVQWLENLRYGYGSAINSAFQPFIMQIFAPEIPEDEGREGLIKGGVYINDWRVQFTTTSVVPGVPSILRVHFLRLSNVAMANDFKVEVTFF